MNMNLLIPAVTVRFLCDSQRKALLIKLLEIFFVSHLLTNFIHNHRLLNFQATKNDDELNWAFKSVSQILASSQISLCLWTIELLIFQRISHFQLDIERVSITNFSEIDHHNTTNTHTGTGTCVHTHLYIDKFSCSLKGESSWLQRMY